MKKKHLLLIFLNIFFGNYLFAQTWTGATNTDWNTATNWSPATVPNSTGNVTIPGSLVKYPVLATDVTINSLNMAAASKLDFNGHILNIITVSANNDIEGATLNNSNGTTDIVINLNTGVGGNVSYLRSTIITDNITFNLSGTNTFFDADGGGTANTYNGNATYNISDGMTFYLSQGAASQFNGDLTINRTVTGGPSQMFNAGGKVGGNFKFSNSLNGAVTLGNGSNITTINGKLDITVKPGTPDYFRLYGFKNHTSGGVINVQNSYGVDVQLDTLNVSSLSITGYHGNSNDNFFNNEITGNLTWADDVTNTSGNVSYLRSNVISGTSNITINGTNTFFDADGGGTGNHFKGDVSYTVTSTATLYISHGATSTYDGNLSINRTGAGSTIAFNSGGIIGGNFSFTNNTAGNTTLGNNATRTSIGGKVDIAINDTLAGYFQLYRLINQTTGGTINVKNSYGVDVQLDTLNVSSLSITGYHGNANANFFNNDITGNLALSDAASYTTGNVSYLRSNVISGTSNITINGTNTFFDADGGGTGNHFAGDVSYTVTGKATLLISHADASKYDGNLSISRTGAGTTYAFNSGAIVGGNFSFTNSTAGDAYIGNNSQHTGIGGKVDIAINDTVPNIFQLNRLINQTTGGIINVQNTYGMDVELDTLKVNSLSITGYHGNNNANFFNNDITGNLTLSDAASYTTGNTTYIRANLITGDASFTKNGTNTFFDADGGGTGNSYSGNVTYNKNGSGNMLIGWADTTSYGGNLTLNNATIALNLIQFTGNNDGIVQQAGSTPITISTLIMNKGGKAKITLMDSVMVTNNLNLNSGIIATGVNSNLVLPVNMTYLGGSDSSYVDGPMLKIGNNAFTFPVGQKNAYAPVTITAPGNATDQFRAQYIHNNPGNDGYDSTQKDATLNHLSRLEYWLLDRTAGTSNVSVTLGWAPNRSGIVNDIPSLRVAHWNGTKWSDLGHGTTTGTNAMGAIQTAAVVTSFSPFTLASTTALNPLPIHISSFSALRQSTSVFLNWSTQNEVNFSHFEVERSGSDNNFSSIGQVAAHNIATLQNYTLEDKSPLKGINLYRLKLIDRDGQVMYSKVVSVIYNEIGTITIYPNPAHDYIQVDGVKEGMAIEINDASGKLVKRFISNASNRYQVSDLHKGMYFIKIQDKENTTVSKLVIE